MALLINYKIDSKVSMESKFSLNLNDVLIYCSVLGVTPSNIIPRIVKIDERISKSQILSCLCFSYFSEERI